MDNPLISKPTSLTDLNAITGIPIPMIMYSDLKNVQKITDIIHPNNPAVYILIDFERAGGQISGHWTILCLFDEQKPNGEVEYSLSYFDSYGKDIDKQMSNIPPSYIKRYFKSKTMLTTLVNASAKEELKIKYIDYNSHEYQLPYTNVCGRYCAYFLIQAAKNSDGMMFDTEAFYVIMRNEMMEYKRINRIPLSQKVEWDQLITWLTV